MADAPIDANDIDEPAGVNPEVDDQIYADKTPVAAAAADAARAGAAAVDAELDEPAEAVLTNTPTVETAAQAAAAGAAQAAGLAQQAAGAAQAATPQAAAAQAAQTRAAPRGTAVPTPAPKAPVVDLTPDEPTDPHRTPSADQVPDMADGDNALVRAGNAVAGVAKSAGTSFMEGLHAMRAVRDASQKSDDARKQIADLQESLEDDRDELSHRTEIEMNYDRISRLQQAAINTARSDAQQARAQGDAATARKADLNDQLAAMKAAHEEKLSPYRSIMESTKGTADDASRALAEARRAAKATESQAADATKRREQTIAQANRNVDSAQDRLRRLQADLDRLQKDAGSSPSAVSKLRGEVVAAHARLDAAKADVVTKTQEAQQSVENAQTHLWTAKQSLEVAERQANEAKGEANARKDEFDTLYKRAMAEQDELKKQIAECDEQIKTSKADISDAAQREQEAQAVLDEANDIHSTPEITTQLKQRILATQKELAEQTAEADKLQSYEQELRHKTREKRLIFIAMAVAIVVIVALVLFFIVKPK